MKNRMPSLALAAALGFACSAPVAAQKAVFVVRHAEKISEQDQRLSEAGHARAARLASMLADSGISAIYATDTERARDTAAPLAGRLKLPIATYDTGAKMSGVVDARPFVASLRRDHGNDVVLVVGHSNTVPDLLQALGCTEKISLGAGEYDDIFVVVPKRDGTATLVRLRY